MLGRELLTLEAYWDGFGHQSNEPAAVKDYVLQAQGVSMI